MPDEKLLADESEDGFEDVDEEEDDEEEINPDEDDADNGEEEVN